jgi:hypothetical protein
LKRCALHENEATEEREDEENQWKQEQREEQAVVKEEKRDAARAPRETEPCTHCVPEINWHECIRKNGFLKASGVHESERPSLEAGFKKKAFTRERKRVRVFCRERILLTQALQKLLQLPVSGVQLRRDNAFSQESDHVIWKQFQFLAV